MDNLPWLLLLRTEELWWDDSNSMNVYRSRVHRHARASEPRPAEPRALARAGRRRRDHAGRRAARAATPRAARPRRHQPPHHRHHHHHHHRGVDPRPGSHRPSDPRGVVPCRSGPSMDVNVISLKRIIGKLAWRMSPIIRLFYTYNISVLEWVSLKL